MSELETRVTADPGDLEELAQIEAWAFGGNTARALQWLTSAGANVRVACKRGMVCGGLVEVPMGQWFGGRSVPTLGLAGVAIPPEQRAQGLALGLVRDALRSARESGLALSTLYPSTWGLYRKAGYELAGSYCRVTLQLRQLPRLTRPVRVESSNAPDHTKIEALYRKVAQQRPGYLDRGAYIWNRVRQAEQQAARVFTVPGPDGLDGYLYARPPGSQRVPFELVLSDFVAQTPDALQSLLALLADHSTTAERAIWHCGPCDARLLGMPGRAIQVAVEDYWMLRIVHAQRALLSRTYPELDLAIDLRIEDDFLPENSGEYPLRVRAGVARLEPGGTEVRAQLSAGALAALYSGFMSPHELRLAGKLATDQRGLAVLGALFAGPAPALSDFF